MSAVTPIPRQHVGRTFIVAISILGLVALAQMTAVAWRFFLPSPQAPAVAPELVAVEESGQLDMNDTFAEPEVAPAPTEIAALPKPTPIAKLRRDTIASGRVQEIVAQAKALRERGDTSTALTRLREAAAIAPANPAILSEMAITYEKMGLIDKAAEQWRHIYELGESAGIYYSAAEAKLQALQLPQGLDASAYTKDSEGFQPGAMLNIVDVTLSEQPDETALKHLTLRVAIKSRRAAVIDVNDVVIQVFFYDMVDNNVMQTTANVSSHWSTLPPNWTDSDIEVLEVEYVQPKPQEGTPLENRTYFGYVVRVYYKNALQDMRAEPVTLLKQYPPPLTLQADEMR